MGARKSSGSTIAFMVALLGLIDCCNGDYAWDSPWTYKCVTDTIDGPACQRDVWNKTSDSDTRIPFSVCILTCGKYGALWPYPSGKIELDESQVDFALENFALGNIDAPTDVIRKWLQNATTIMLDNVLKSRADYANVEDKQSPNSVIVKLVVTSPVEKFLLGVDESYTLTIATDDSGTDPIANVLIEGATVFGVRHGLETLSQLIAYNYETGFYQIASSVSIKDAPTYRYRGILIDTGRNFIPMDNLKRVVDGLSYNKMNILHWHLTDSNSFPFESKRVPQVTRYGIHGAKKLYSVQDALELIQYANLRGVKIIPELDAPSHAGNGWQWGPLEGLGELSLCINAQPYKSYCIQPPCGQLNPLNNNTYFILGELFKDFLDVFDRDVFHMGGDEISYRCWESYSEIQEWMATNSLEIIDLWGQYQEKALEKLKIANNGEPITAIVWTSEMTNFARRFLPPEDYIVQVWSQTNDSVIKDLLTEQYRVVFSNNDTVYLDHGFGGWRGTQNKATLKSWQNIYENDILGIASSLVGSETAMEMLNSGQLLGGEATLWSEKVDAQNMEMKLWPRGSAYAERLWSNPAVNLTRFAYPRLIHHRQRLVQRGIQADTLLPEACYNIWGFCDDPDP